MEISLRLRTVATMVDKCECIADIGTDHAYLPIYLIKNKICNKAIASDINKGPVEKARFNIKLENLQDKIQCRLGAGLKTIKHGEIQGIIIAGMGGNLIKDILDENIDIFKEVKFAVLQPVQNPEVLRKYIYEKEYKIIDEELCLDDGKFYEILKIAQEREPKELDSIFYEVGKVLFDKKHPVLKDFINVKINKYTKILNNIKEDTMLAQNRKNEIGYKIKKLKELLKCL